MRIQVVTSLFPLPERPFEGGFALRRWSGMARRGHPVDVLHPLPQAFLPTLPGRYGAIARAPREERVEGLRVRRPRYLHLPGRAIGNAERFAAAAARALSPGTEVVVCDYAWPACRLAPLLARSAGPPCVVSGRGSDVLQVAADPRLAALLSDGLSAAGAWCAVSEDLVRRMDRLGGREGVGVLVPNGVDGGLFAPRERAVARRELGLEAHGALVLVVGHWIERKDPLLALEAFARGAPAGARLVFLGRGPLEARLRAAIGERRLSGRVQLIGELPPRELATWYAACDLVLSTSRREGRPNVVLEALSCGRPVVATEAGGTAEILDEELGLVRSRDASEIGRRVASQLAAPPRVETLRAAVAHLDWDSSLGRLERLLEAVRGKVGVRP